MRILVELKVESLLRDLRLAGHALAESAEMTLLRAARRHEAAAPQMSPRILKGTPEGRNGGEA